MGRALCLRFIACGGHYVLGKTIGEGTFGKVKLGTHLLTNESVAIKILEKQKIQGQADIDRIGREIHILKLIRHPHIIQLFEVIYTPGNQFPQTCPESRIFAKIIQIVFYSDN